MSSFTKLELAAAAAHRTLTAVAAVLEDVNLLTALLDSLP